MSNIAKVFIVINFVLSILYLGFAATLLAQKWDYRQMYLVQEYRQQQETAALRAKIQDAGKRSESFERYLKQAKKTINEKLTENTNLNRNYEEVKRTNQSYSAALAKIQADIKDINEKLAKKETRISQLENEKEQLKEMAEEARKAKEEALDEQQRMELPIKQFARRVG